MFTSDARSRIHTAPARCAMRFVDAQQRIQRNGRSPEANQNRCDGALRFCQIRAFVLIELSDDCRVTHP